MKTAIAFAVVAVLLAPSAARAQSWEASGLFGFTPSAAIDERAPELSDVDIRGAFTWGLQGARFFTTRLGAEVLWTQQHSALEIGTAVGKADLFTMTVRQLEGNVVYRLGRAGAKWEPFVFGGLGATFLSADTLESETKFSLDVGGGVKYFPWQSIGVRAQFRYKPTFLNDTSSGRFCDPFGFCQGVLQQMELSAGVVVRF
jgi:opacity protein-like surface antigen